VIDDKLPLIVRRVSKIYIYNQYDFWSPEAKETALKSIFGGDLPHEASSYNAKATQTTIGALYHTVLLSNRFRSIYFIY